ncbi:MAG: hypothetical protein V1735_00920 [Nanoarchaeota archaeon]
MGDFRRVAIALVIAALFSIFVFSFNWAVNPSPRYDLLCRGSYETYPVKAIPPGTVPAGNITCPAFTDATQAEKDACVQKGADFFYQYDFNGCPTAWKCDTCQLEFNAAQASYKFWEFLIAAFFGLVAIIIGLWLPTDRHSLNELVSTGFLLGGLITLFIGTGIYWEFFPPHTLWLRPVIILFELLLVIFIAYRKLGNKEQKGKSGKKK